jgi:hypothetical protein
VRAQKKLAQAYSVLDKEESGLHIDCLSSHACDADAAWVCTSQVMAVMELPDHLHPFRFLVEQ